MYRVLDLPPSMRPLVYDFGQLKRGTEDDYIKQIVHDHVSNALALYVLYMKTSMIPIMFICLKGKEAQASLTRIHR